MTFKSKPSEHLKKVLRRLKRKDRALFVAVRKKMKQIASLSPAEIDHFKNLRGSLSEYKRVKVGSFVLFFKLEGDTIAFDRLVHHDGAY